MISESTALTRDTEIRFMSSSSITELGRILDVQDSWKILMSSIKRGDSQQTPKYSLTQIQVVENHATKTRQSAALVLFDEWGTSGRQRPTLGQLHELLVELELYRAADYIAINILGVPPVRKPRNTPSPPPDMMGLELMNGTLVQDPVQVPYLELETACHWRDGGAVVELGGGGFSSVFLAHLPHRWSDLLAVKRLNTNISNIDKQFFTELNALSRYRHKNLLRLLGYSCDGPSYCLIYEYMNNGTLQTHLRLENDVPPLQWPHRLSIAKDVAEALVYLHTAQGEPLIHRDVKPANILLTKEFVAKVGDFGLVKLSNNVNPTQNGSVNSSSVTGTSVYMAPEAHCGDVSILVDTFSFGVVLLELLTSLPPIDETRTEWDLIAYLNSTCGAGPITPLLCLRAGDWGGPGHQHAHSLYRIARQCIQDVELRPSMTQVFAMLNEIQHC